MDLSIITINYNTHNFTLECIESILSKTNTSLNYEIIVVDNNSEIDDYKALKSKIPQKENIHLIRSRKNLGFGGGNNLGLNYAQGKYYAFFNNDSELLDNCFLALFQYMEENKDVGVIGPRIVDENQNFIMGFGHFHDLLMNCTGVKLYESITKKISYREDQNQVLKVDFIIGSMMFFRAQVFDEVGGFDSNIFLYYEEMDICYRLKERGYERVYFPKCTYRHKKSKSSGKSHNHVMIRKEQHISYNYFFRKAYGPVCYFLFYHLWLVKSLVKVILNPTVFVPLIGLHLKGSRLIYSLKQVQDIGDANVK